MTLKKFTVFIAHRSTTSLLALVFAIGLLLAGAYFWAASAQLAKSEVATLGHTLAKQTTFLLRPLLLADDRISTNYLLQELQATDYVTGLQLTDRQGNVVGRSGEEEGVKIQRKMVQNERELATLTLWLSPAPLQTLLRQQLLICLLIALLIMTLSLMLLRYKAAADNTILRAAQPEPAPQPLTDTDARHPDDTAKQTGDSDSSAEDGAAPPLPDPTRVEQPATGDSGDPPPSPPTPEPEPEQEPEPDTQATDADTVGTWDTEDPTPAQHTSADTEDLRGRDEIQLDLYSFEHEMELLLTPEDAGYLLHIDTTSAHTEYADSELRADLLHTYQQLANQVAHIYSGELIQLANGDIQILFATPQERDAHGVNAVCAGLLFTLLYRGYNKSRIGQFLPVLNFHTALVRGRHDRLALLQEEARFLTRTTQSNELISHTALTEAPDIKATLLKDADIRREDEDKVLIHKVKKRYQELFEKQANHLLIKLKQLQTSHAGQ